MNFWLLINCYHSHGRAPGPVWLVGGESAKGKSDDGGRGGGVGDGVIVDLVRPFRYCHRPLRDQRIYSIPAAARRHRNRPPKHPHEMNLHLHDLNYFKETHQLFLLIHFFLFFSEKLVLYKFFFCNIKFKGFWALQRKTTINRNGILVRKLENVVCGVLCQTVETEISVSDSKLQICQSLLQSSLG